MIELFVRETSVSARIIATNALKGAQRFLPVFVSLGVAGGAASTANADALASANKIPDNYTSKPIPKNNGFTNETKTLSRLGFGVFGLGTSSVDNPCTPLQEGAVLDGIGANKTESASDGSQTEISGQHLVGKDLNGDTLEEIRWREQQVDANGNGSINIVHLLLAQSNTHGPLPSFLEKLSFNVINGVSVENTYKSGERCITLTTHRINKLRGQTGLEDFARDKEPKFLDSLLGLPNGKKD